MLDVAIIGGGLCGLALARQLHAGSRDFALFEARARLGGRVLTQRCAATGAALDLGATWFWPDSEPRIAALLDELGLGHFAQHDSGDVLQLSDPNQAPQVLPMDGVHGGARRIDGGAGKLIEALAAGLPPQRLHLGMRLQSVALQDEGVALTLVGDDGPVHIAARRVVLALPPRLAAERVEFTPALERTLFDAMAATPTWMAAQAKALVTYDTPFWRAAGRSGNAFVDHVQVVLREVFDACDARAERGVLGGFFALPPALRTSFSVGMPMLVSSQLAQLFGAEADADATRLHMHDWASDADTCATADRDAFAAAPAAQGCHPLLRQSHWRGRLHFGATETASHGACHMEGALDAAARIARALTATGAAVSAHADAGTALAAFAAWVGAARDAGAARYRGHLTRLLATQQYDQLTQRALLAAVEQTYSEALAWLGAHLPAIPGTAVTAGRSELTPLLLAPFSGWSKQLIEQALEFNGTSCALSNFPAEHHPSGDDVMAMGRDLAAAWQEFALAANDLLVARSAMPPQHADGPLLGAMEEAGIAVLTLSEAVERAELLASRLTRGEVQRQLHIIAAGAARLDPRTRDTIAEVDWNAWHALALLLGAAPCDALDEALWCAVSERVPALLMWMRTYRSHQPQLFQAR